MISYNLVHLNKIPSNKRKINLELLWKILKQF